MENRYENFEFEQKLNSPTPQEIKDARLKIIMDSKAFADRMHPKHGLAMAEFRRAMGLPIRGDDEILNSIDEEKNAALMEIEKDPAFIEPLNPRHKEVMARFFKVNGMDVKQ
jgi:hypothetical protein